MPAPERIQSGQSLPGIRASDHNAFVETWEKVKGLVLAGAGTGASDGAQRVTCLIKNTTGALIDEAFPVLEITKPVFTVTDSTTVIRHGISLEGDTPGVGVGINDIAIVQGAIPDGEYREAVVLGPTWCRIDVTDANHTHAIPKDNDNTQLASSDGSTGGVPIVWKETGTGTLWAFIILGACCGGAGGDCQITVGCGLTIIDNDLRVDASVLRGAGLTGSTLEGECPLDVNPGQGIEVRSAENTVNALLGNCLEFDEFDRIAVQDECVGGGGGVCALEVGCGIDIIADTIQIRRGDLLGLGLEAGSGSCDINVKLGAGLEFDGNGAIQLSS